MIKKHEQIAQIRPIEVELYSIDAEYTPQVSSIQSPSTTFSETVVIDPDGTTDYTYKSQLCNINREFDEVFSPDLGMYNGASGPFEHVINIGSTVPPQRRGRNPAYNRNNMEILQSKMDELVQRGVLAKPEDLNVNVEYVSPSFLVKKPSGGHRLVTAFNQLTEYVKTQPEAMPNVDDVLRQIAQWKFLIKTDITDAYYNIPLNKDSMRLTGIVSPFSKWRNYSC